MSEPKRVLIAGFTTEMGGMESYVMNLYRHINRDRLQFDFVNNLDGQIAFADEITQMGGRIFNIPMLRNGFAEHFKAMDRVFGNTKFEAIYYQSTRKLKNSDLFRYAKKYKVPHRILHSHSTRNLTESRINKARIFLTEKLLKLYVTDRFACSAEAGEWMFPGAENVIVVNNGVDSAVFEYDRLAAIEFKKKNNAENKKVYGAVGRISTEKNPLFLVDVFSEIHKRDENTVFWHIGGGGGALEDSMHSRIRELGLVDSYIMFGRQKNVPEFMNAMDLMLLPSLYEGFPIVLVEAQCSGLKCLVSDTITKKVDITGDVVFASIKDTPEKWGELARASAEYERRSCSDIIIDKGFDEQTIANWFEEYILGE